MIVVPEGKAQTVLMAQWACNILGDKLETFGFDRNGDPLFSAVGFSIDGDMKCVVVAYQYAKPNIVFAFAASSPRWATKGNIAALGTWAFDNLGCERITVFIIKNNRRSRKFVEGMGFQHEGKLRRASQDGDVIVYGLMKEDHEAWLRKAYGEKGRRKST